MHCSNKNEALAKFLLRKKQQGALTAELAHKVLQLPNIRQAAASNSGVPSSPIMPLRCAESSPAGVERESTAKCFSGSDGSSDEAEAESTSSGSERTAKRKAVETSAKESKGIRKHKKKRKSKEEKKEKKKNKKKNKKGRKD